MLSKRKLGWEYKIKLFLKEQLLAKFAKLALRTVWHFLPPKVYDCTIFFNESMIFKLRIKEIAELVDYFVVVESLITFTGVDRESFCFPEVFKSLPDDVKEKIIYIQLTRKDFPPEILRDPWSVEAFTRNQIKRGLQNVKPYDYLIISDADDIPRYSVIKNKKLGKLKLSTSYYKFNLFGRNDPSLSAKALCGLDIALFPPDTIRKNDKCLISSYVDNAGWHFSFIMSNESILIKLNSYAHQEYDHLGLKDLNYIQNCINTGQDLFQRPNITYVPISVSMLPASITSNLEYYKDFLHYPLV